MTIGGLLFIIGAALQAGAVHLAMLIVGRIMLGFGVGLANQVGQPFSNIIISFRGHASCAILPCLKRWQWPKVLLALHRHQRHDAEHALYEDLELM